MAPSDSFALIVLLRNYKYRVYFRTTSSSSRFNLLDHVRYSIRKIKFDLNLTVLKTVIKMRVPWKTILIEAKEGSMIFSSNVSQQKRIT